ncbi:LytTR family DNA-binding domain-containing protein [Luteimonas sp. e5]
MAAALWVAVFVLGASSNVLTAAVDAWRNGRPFDWGTAVIGQATSIAASLALLPLLLRALRRWPLQSDNWLRRLLAYLPASMLWSLLHVMAMVALRKWAYAAMGGHYDYGPWGANLLYEYGKDARDFFLIVTAVHAFDWFQRRRQGEARVLDDPDPGVPAVPEAASGHPTRFLVRKLNREFLLAVDDIEWLRANGNYVNLHVAGREYPLRSTMAAIEKQLDPAHFMRVHRGVIVHLRFLASIEPTDAGDARLHMHDGTVLPCSRSHREALRAAAAQSTRVNASP